MNNKEQILKNYFCSKMVNNEEQCSDISLMCLYLEKLNQKWQKFNNLEIYLVFILLNEQFNENVHVILFLKSICLNLSYFDFRL